MNEGNSLCTHAASQKNVHCFNESGHFHIIVTQSDTLKRWTAVSRQRQEDHPPR